MPRATANAAKGCISVRNASIRDEWSSAAGPAAPAEDFGPLAFAVVLRAVIGEVYDDIALQNKAACSP